MAKSTGHNDSAGNEIFVGDELKANATGQIWQVKEGAYNLFYNEDGEENDEETKEVVHQGIYLVNGNDEETAETFTPESGKWFTRL